MDIQQRPTADPIDRVSSTTIALQLKNKKQQQSQMLQQTFEAQQDDQRQCIADDRWMTKKRLHINDIEEKPTTSLIKSFKQQVSFDLNEFGSMYINILENFDG